MKKLTLILAVFITAMFATSVTAQTQLGTPTIKSASGVSTTGLTAYWTAGTGTATTFTVTIYDATSTVVTTGSAATGTSTLAITGLTLAKNTPYTYTVTAIGDQSATTNSAESPKSIPFYIQTDNQVVFKYAVADIATLLNDLKSATGATGAADIYELTESGGAYTFVTTTANNVVMVKNTTVRAVAGLSAKPIIKLNTTAVGTTTNIFYTATANMTFRFDGLEFDGANPGIGGYQPTAIYDSNTGTTNIQLYITNCYFHDFKAVSGNGVIRMNASGGNQTLDIQGSTINNCGGKILNINGTTTSPTTTINLKNNTFSNITTISAKNYIICNNVANPGNTTIDHCTFYKVADAAVTTGIVKTTGTNGTITIKNSTFVTAPTTITGATVSYCYLGGLNSAPTNTNTLGTAPTYGAGASNTPPDLTITNRGSLVGSDGLTAGNDTYYNLSMPAIGTGSGATSGGFTANWTVVANASSYDVYVYQNGTQVGSALNASGQATATLAISGLDASTAYTYRVMAKGDGTNYFNSVISAASTSYSTLAASGTKLATPTASAATSMTTFSFIANWSNTDANASGGYNVKVYNGATLVNTYNASSPSATSLLINTGLTYNTAYTYTVTAIGNGGTFTNSDASGVISVSTNDRTTLTTPTAGAGTPANNGFTASWSADANASSFSIKTYVGSILLSTTTSAAGTTSVAVSGLMSGLDYTYTVTSVGDGITYNTSATSAAQSFTTTGRVSNISTDFNDNSWGTVLLTSPVTGSYGSYSFNGFDLNSSVVYTGSKTGPKGETHTNRIAVDKLANGGTVVLPTLNSVEQFEIHAVYGSIPAPTKSFNLDEYNSSTNTWSTVTTFTQTSTSWSSSRDTIFIFNVSRASASKFRLSNQASSSLYICQIIARTTAPALLSVSPSTANAIKATTATANWIAVTGATSYNVKVYLQKHLSGVFSGTSLKFTGSASGASASSLAVTGLQADSLYNYTVQAIGNGDVAYSDSYISVASANFTTAHQDYYQTSGSGNWGDVSTWQSSTDNATWSNTIIAPSSASSVASIAILNGHTITVDANASASTLNVNPGSKLTLNSGINFNVNTLNLNSDATNGTGTFVDNGGTLTAGTTNVQQYLTSGRNWYISSPVSGATSNVFNAASNVLYSYDETNAAWPQISDNGTGLGVMTGYVANMATNGAVTFTGTLNTGAQQIGLTRHAGVAKEGFNLVGNPYPSYLNFESALASTSTANVSSTMWFRSKNAATWIFDAYNAVSHIGTSNNNNSSIAVTADIAPMQSVWVKVNAGQTTGTLAVDNTMRSHQDQSVVTNRFKAPATTEPVLHLKVSNGTNSDEAILLFNSNASNGLDSYDSPKMSNESTSIPEIYTLAGTEKVAINGVNDMTQLTLGFTTGEANNFSIKASQFANFASGTQIVLRDNLLNYEQDLTLGDYKFYSDVTANNETRFTVLIKAPSVATGIDQNSNGNVWISLANNQIVLNGANSETSVAVYNAVGQKIMSDLTQLKKSLTTGVYMVTVNNAGKSVTQKVIIK